MCSYIVWETGEPYWNFLDRLHAHAATSTAKTKSPTASEDVDVCLLLRRPFLDSYIALGQEARDLVCEALMSVPITRVCWYHGFPRVPNSVRMPALRQLGTALGAIPTITGKAEMQFNSLAEADACGYLIENLQRITELQIYRARYDNAENENASSLPLANALMRHPSLQRLKMTLPRSFWPMTLPAIQTIPSLKSVDLTRHKVEENGIVGLEFLAGMIPPNTAVDEVVLRDFDFTQDDANQRLSDMIVNGQLKGIAFHYCRLRDCSVFFEALASSRLQSFCFSYLDFGYNQAPPLSFMRSLGRALARMSELKVLECDEKDADALASLLCHVALSSSLRSLKVRHPSFPPTLDLSLSECVRHQNALVDIALHPNYGGSEKHAIPKFAEALKTNYVVQKVTFAPHDPTRYAFCPWDPVCRGNIERLVRLNVAGSQS